MIDIPFDEAGAFDLLSIAQIKRQYGLDAPYKQLILAIKLGIGTELALQIIASPEYDALFAANQYMWLIQEQSMRDECKASDVDKQNQARYHAKQALQKRFFSTPLTEQKTIRPYEQQP